MVIRNHYEACSTFYIYSAILLQIIYKQIYPISLLPLLSKLIEKIIYKRIYQYLDDFNLLDHRQGGFWPKHSTAKICSHFVNDLFTTMNNNNLLLLFISTP